MRSVTRQLIATQKSKFWSKSNFEGLFECKICVPRIVLFSPVFFQDGFLYSYTVFVPDQI